MSDLRKDPIVGRWVIIAENRAKRPHDFDVEAAPRRVDTQPCPFCEGNECETPSEIAAYRDNGSSENGPGWRVRVVPNKFPALESDVDCVAASQRDGMYRWQTGLGSHEVIVESPRHLVACSQLSTEAVGEVLCAYRDRLLDLGRDRRLAYALIFKNVGPAAGATLEHLHSQLIATPVVPVAVAEEMAGSLEFFRRMGRCVYCEMVEEERAIGKRMVADTPEFAAFAPFASRFQFETWIVPRSHASRLETIGKSEIDALASVLKRVLGKIEAALDRASYNYVIHTAPFHSGELPHYHWHMEILPALTKAAGFEWGTGFAINPVPPEDAAARLRAVEPACDEPLTFLSRETG